MMSNSYMKLKRSRKNIEISVFSTLNGGNLYRSVSIRIWENHFFAGIDGKIITKKIKVLPAQEISGVVAGYLPRVIVFL